MTIKKAKFNVEFVLSIDDISIGDIMSTYESMTSNEERKTLNQGGIHLRKLFKALLENEDIFKKYMSQHLTGFVEDNTGLINSKLNNIEGAFSSADILEPLLDTLPEESKNFFEKVREKDLLPECFYPIYAALGLGISNISIEVD